jgi:thymidine phosphorylase
VFCETKWRPQDLRNKALLLASIIDMVHGTKKQKWTTACEGNSFIRTYKSSLHMQAQGGFREPEFALYKKILKPKSGVVTEIDNRRLAKIAKLAGATVKQGVTKTPLTTSAKGDVLCIYSETKAS